MVLFRKNVFSALIMRFFGKKLKNKIKKVFFSRKKRFHLLIGLLYKKGKAQIIPVVGGCLVTVYYYKLLFINCYETLCQSFCQYQNFANLSNDAEKIKRSHFFVVPQGELREYWQCNKLDCSQLCLTLVLEGTWSQKKNIISLFTSQTFIETTKVK